VPVHRLLAEIRERGYPASMNLLCRYILDHEVPVSDIAVSGEPNACPPPWKYRIVSARGALSGRVAGEVHPARAAGLRRRGAARRDDGRALRRPPPVRHGDPCGGTDSLRAHGNSAVGIQRPGGGHASGAARRDRVRADPDLGGPSVPRTPATHRRWCPRWPRRRSTSGTPAGPGSAASRYPPASACAVPH